MSQTDNETVKTTFDLNIVIIRSRSHLVTTCSRQTVSPGLLRCQYYPLLGSSGANIILSWLLRSINPDKNDAIIRLKEE